MNLRTHKREEYMKFTKLVLAIYFVIFASAVSACSTSTSQNNHNLSVEASGRNMPMGTDGMMSGSTDGSATGTFTVNENFEEICYSIMTKSMTRINEAHIQVTSSEEDVVLFDITKMNMMDESCMNVDPNILKDMVEHPDKYSLMVHTDAFPDGAVMGSLK